MLSLGARRGQSILLSGCGAEAKLTLLEIESSVADLALTEDGKTTLFSVNTGSWAEIPIGPGLFLMRASGHSGRATIGFKADGIGIIRENAKKKEKK